MSCCIYQMNQSLYLSKIFSFLLRNHLSHTNPHHTLSQHNLERKKVSNTRRSNTKKFANNFGDVIFISDSDKIVPSTTPQRLFMNAPPSDKNLSQNFAHKLTLQLLPQCFPFNLQLKKLPSEKSQFLCVFN